MSSRAKHKRVQREVQGYMALCIFGCHCGQTAEGNDFRGSFIMTHLREAHPAIYACALNPRVTLSVEVRVPSLRGNS